VGRSAFFFEPTGPVQALPAKKVSIMFPFWCELSGSQLLQWISSAVMLVVCLVNLAAGQRNGC